MTNKQRENVANVGIGLGTGMAMGGAIIGLLGWGPSGGMLMIAAGVILAIVLLFGGQR